MDNLISPDFKKNYLILIAQGSTESKALAHLEIDWLDFFELCAIDPDFRKDIEHARKGRAEIWVNKIAESIEPVFVKNKDGVEVEVIPGKEETGFRKLQFEKLKFLAKADNPDRYGETSGKGPSVEINLNDFKLLSPQEAIKTLNNDPFNKLVIIDAETKEKTND